MTVLIITNLPFDVGAIHESPVRLNAEKPPLILPPVIPTIVEESRAKSPTNHPHKAVLAKEGGDVVDGRIG